MKNCQEQLQNLGEIVDQSAPFRRRLQFYMHIGMCEKCRDYFEQFKLMKKAAETVTEDDLPGDFFSVMEQALASIEAK